jgi:RimJ/RimL family protein N-acetyltransferase
MTVRTPELPATVSLRDGRSVSLREILPGDKAALQAAVGNMSADSRYTRFMATVRELSEPMLEAATHPVPERECALVAVAAAGSGESIVGGARYASDQGSDTCEFAIAIVDGWQGVGLAPQLMKTLMADARAHGFKTMEGYVLAANAPMRGLARRLGFRDTPYPGDASTRLVRCELAGGAEVKPD